MMPAAVPALRPLRRVTEATDGSQQPCRPKVAAVLALDNVVPFDLSVPCEVFKRVVLPSGQPGYEVRVCGAGSQPGMVRAGLFELRPDWSIDGLAGADTVIVPGTDPLGPIPPAVLEALRAARAAGTRIVSICTGAFVLAATGMLDGLRATTHWAAAGELARRYPHVDVDPDVLYVDNGQVLFQPVQQRLEAHPVRNRRSVADELGLAAAALQRHD
ncbi:MAG TPA: DJ-1/PfpI family protein [Streptosporangiaceae bacterium]|nr:DJ-1/PfpI family protein [Streptosporangiaceae bacterium]